MYTPKIRNTKQKALKMRIHTLQGLYLYVENLLQAIISYNDIIALLVSLYILYHYPILLHNHAKCIYKWPDCQK